MRSIVRTKLRKNILHVRFDRFLGDVQELAHDLVGIAVRYRAQHFDFTFSQCVVTMVLGDVHRDFGRDSLFARVNCSNRVDQFLPHHVLQQIA